jgi:energy-coupling factor transporter ATP-binding protein EcfA2
MKLLDLKIQNVKRISHASIQLPASGLILFTGRNAQGKSSLLDALGYLFEGKSAMAAEPIHAGKDKAIIEGRLTPPAEQVAKLKGDAGPITVRRTISRGEDGFTTRLQVEGMNYKTPQALLDSFLGAFTLDPLKFLSMKPVEQFNALRIFVPGVDFDAIDAENKRDYDDRTDVNRIIRDDKARLAAMPDHQGLPDVAPDIQAILDQVTGAAAHNNSVEDQRRRRERDAEQIQTSLRMATEDLRKAEDLRRQADDLERGAVAIGRDCEGRQNALEGLPALPDLIDVATASAELQSAQRVIALLNEKKARDDLVRKIESREFESESYTDAINDRKAAKDKAIAEAKLPVPGLGFGDGIVILDGFPISQASQAQQLTVALSLAMAANPQFQFVRVRDGNGCDPGFLQLIADLADEKGFQVIMERVSAPDGFPAFVIENGEVISRPESEAA